MSELISLAFSPINVVFSILLLSIIAYWITVILGVLDTDLFNVELPDPDLDLDMEADVDADAETDVDLDTGVLWGILHWFYVGEVPVMVLLSLFILSLWAFAILGNYYFNPDQNGLRALALLAGNLIASAMVLKLTAAPLRPVYALLNKDYNAPAKVIGSPCRVTTTAVTAARIGQVEVTTKGAPIRLNVRAKAPHTFRKGDEALIVDKDKKSGIYHIVPNNLEK